MEYVEEEQLTIPELIEYIKSQYVRIKDGRVEVANRIEELKAKVDER